MNITIVEMGYVGIPVAALLADKPNNQVTGIQRQSQRSDWKINILRPLITY